MMPNEHANPEGALQLLVMVEDLVVPVVAEEKPKRKVQRRAGNTLDKWEVGVVKAMIARGGSFTNDQDILAYFTRPSRTVNHRLIGEIRNAIKHKDVKAADEAELMPSSPPGRTSTTIRVSAVVATSC